MATPSRILAWRIQDRGAWRAAAPGIPKSQTRLSDLARQRDVFLSLCQLLTPEFCHCVTCRLGSQLLPFQPALLSIREGLQT